MRYVDLFSGIGGFRQAAETADIGGHKLSPVAWSDVDPVCARFYQEAFNTSGELYFDDVREVSRSPTRGADRLTGFDVLFGGFPCQPFANIGQGGGLGDPRGQLFFEIITILKRFTPSFFILENVQKLRNHDRGDTLARVIGMLDLAGYHVLAWDLCASNYGVPQQRRRLFFCGARKADFQRLEVLVPRRVDPERSAYPSTWHLLERRMPHDHLVPAGTRDTVLRRNPKWQGDLEIDRKIARPLTATMAKWHRANQDNYFSEAYVLGEFAGGGKPCVDLETVPIRRITPLEGFRLQGFPDRFDEIRRILGLKSTPAYRLIGNAVPVSMARRVIESFIGSYLAADAVPSDAKPEMLLAS